jgi:hypothetical protein
MMKNMYMCVILLLRILATNMLMNIIILIMTKKRLNLTNLRIEMYSAEGPMLKAPVAPDPLMVSCSKSRTTVGAGRYTQCHPSNVHREEVVDHSWCRKIYIVLSLECPPRSRWSRSEEEEAPPERRWPKWQNQPTPALVHDTQRIAHLASPAAARARVAHLWPLSTSL